MQHPFVTPPLPSRWARGLGVAVLATAAFVAHAQTSGAPSASLPDAREVQAYATRLLDEASLPADGPGVAVLVARGDQVLFEGARGRASIELGVPLTPENRFRIGSVTKQFAAATLLKLVEQGRASLDDPLSKYLPDYPKGDGITLAQLLNHTSGVKSYTSLPRYMGNPVRRDLNTRQLIDEFKDQPVDFAPGQRWAYNNSGYVLVGAVIEKITGKAWHLAMDELVLRPNGLAHTVYPGEQRLVPGMAQGYSFDPSEGGVVTAGLISMTQPQAAGALVSDVRDLWRWNRALHGGQVLGPALYARMTTPEGAARDARYGFGINRLQFRGQTRLEHGGGIHGFVSSLSYYPASGVSVVVLRNTDGPGFNLSQFALKLSAFALGQPYPELKPVSLTDAELQALTGDYRLGSDAKVLRQLTVREGQLLWVREGRPPLVLVPVGADRFQLEGTVALMQAHRDTANRLLAVSFHPQGELDEPGERWERAVAAPPAASAPASAPAPAIPPKQ